MANKKLSDKVKKNLLDLKYNKYLSYYNTSIILLSTYFIGISIAFITNQINYRSINQLISVILISTKFNSIKEWKDYCFSTHRLYLKSPHFRKWIDKKEIYIFNFSRLKNNAIKAITLGVKNAIKIAKLHFKIYYGYESSVKNIIYSKYKVINSNKILKRIMEERKKNHKENANILIFNNPIKSQDYVIKDGEALTYVSKGITIFSFDAFKDYPPSFLMRRGKHEALHLLGLNSHHEDTKVKGYKHNVSCNMDYNAPTQSLCRKCKDGLIYFWRGVGYATKKQSIKN